MHDSDDNADGVLVERLRDGDRHALAELFALYHRPLKRMVDVRLDQRLRGRLSASDVLQEAFVDAAKRVEHFLDKPAMPFLVWARLITAQRLVDVHRQHLGAQMRDAGQEVQYPGTSPTSANSMWLADLMAASLTSPTQAARQAELRGQLHQALEQLEPIDREVLCLRHFEELSNRDTALILGIDISAASKRYLRALARLKQVVDAMPELREGDSRS